MFGEFRERLERLRSLDPRCRVFGSSAHRYLSTPVDAREVDRCEDQFGVEFPGDYRAFMTEVGPGAGPYYGLWGPRTSLEVFANLAQDLRAETGAVVRPSDPFPLTRSDLDEIDRLRAAGSKASWSSAPWPAGGCMPICPQGCTYYSVLVLRGEFAGKVWDLSDEGPDGGWMPAHRPPGWWAYGMNDPKPLPPLPRPPTFGAWFGGWIKRCLLDLEDRARYDAVGPGR